MASWESHITLPFDDLTDIGVVNPSGIGTASMLYMTDEECAQAAKRKKKHPLGFVGKKTYEPDPKPKPTKKGKGKKNR